MPRVEGAGLAEGVEQGQAAEEHVAGADVEQGLHGSGGVAEEVAARQFGALRRAGAGSRMHVADGAMPRHRAMVGRAERRGTGEVVETAPMTCEGRPIHESRAAPPVRPIMTSTPSPL